MANVKFEYLFLDIEWNQAPKTTDIEEREPVQIEHFLNQLDQVTGNVLIRTLLLYPITHLTLL